MFTTSNQILMRQSRQRTAASPKPADKPSSRARPQSYVKASKQSNCSFGRQVRQEASRDEPMEHKLESGSKTHKASASPGKGLEQPETPEAQKTRVSEGPAEETEVPNKGLLDTSVASDLELEQNLRQVLATLNVPENAPDLEPGANVSDHNLEES